MERAEQDRHVREQEQSGMSQAEYCRDKGISPSALSEWRKRAKVGNSGAEFARVGAGREVSVCLLSGIIIKSRIEDLKAVLGSLE